MNSQEINQEQIPLAKQLGEQRQLTQQQRQERKKVPMEMCNEGRNYLNQKKYLQASKGFAKAIMGFEFLLKQQIINKQQTHYILKECIIPSYSNLSLCYLKLESYQAVISMATQTLNHQNDNVKALYRRGIAYQKLKKFEQAIADFQKMIRLDPSEEQLGQQLINQCKRLKTQERQKQRRIAKKLIENYYTEQDQGGQDKQEGCLKKISRCITAVFRKLIFWRQN